MQCKGDAYSPGWSPAVKVYHGTKVMPMAMTPDTDDGFRMAPLGNGQPVVWEEITVRTLAY